jgi:eukaryotic-like serine/threonine-protein kinase
MTAVWATLILTAAAFAASPLAGTETRPRERAATVDIESDGQTAREPARMILGDAGSLVLLSPDGSAVLFWDRQGLVRVRRLAERLPRPLPGTEGATMPFWAGDSSAVGFFQQGKICIQSLSAAGIRCLADAPEPGGAAWRGPAATGDIVFASGATLMHLSLASGSLREVPVTFPEGHFPWRPRFLPHGEDVVVTAATRDRDNQTLYRVSSKDGALDRLIDTPYTVEFTRDPHDGQWYMVYGSRLSHSSSPIPALMAVPVDPATGRATGRPTQLVEAIGTNPFERRIAVTLSDNGTIAFRRHREAAPVYQIRWYAPDGKLLASLGDKMSIKDIALSPDENAVAAIAGYPARHILIFDARSGNSRRLTTPADSLGDGLAWSPDGSHLYYQLEGPDGTWRIVRRDAKGATRPVAIGQSDVTVTLMDLSPDGRYLLFGPNEARSSSYLWLRTDGAPDSRLEMWGSAGTSFGWANARFTPDGKFVFASVGPNQARFIPWHPDEPTATAASGTVPFTLRGRFFSPDGRRLCGPDDGTISCLSVTVGPDGHPLLGPAAVQFGGVEALTGNFSKIGAAARDGRFLLFTTDDVDEISWQLLTDWTTLLR